MEQEERRKKEAIEISLKRKEKEEKIWPQSKKMKN